MDLSFSGAGFMGCYYFGVVNCWDKYIPRERVRRVAGASAGSLIAAYYLMDLPLTDCLKEIIELSEEARSKPLGVFDRSNQIVDALPRALDKLFPEDAHKRVNGRLYVCMTRLRDFKSVVVNEFETRKDLIDALNCSCFIPVWSGNHVSTYKGVKYIDGGFTNNMPVFDEHTIRVSCFAGASDIAPYDRARMEMLKASVNGMSVNLSWRNFRRAGRALWPPPVHFIIELLERGFHDTKEFILSNDLIQCDRCFKVTERQHQPIYSRITPTISPASSPAVSRAPSLLNLAELQRIGGGSFRLQLSKRANDSKRRSREKSSSSKHNDDKENWKAPPLPPVHIKEHRRKSATGFETDRSKSGKRIARKALERLRLESEVVEEDDQGDLQRQREQGPQVQPGFASKLREKLQQVAAVRSTGPEAKRPNEEKKKKKQKKLNNDNDKNGYDTGEQKQQATREMVPTIVVEQAPPSSATGVQPEGQEAPKADLMKSRENGSSSSELKLRTSSLSSSASNDSAVVLETPCSSSVMSGSPAEKYLAGAKQRAQSLSLACGTNLLASSQTPADRFSLAPSPLPSCPPSPNLNRHCTECIRLRQQARTDGIDESIRQAAELFCGDKSKEPEREFSSIKWKLACWLRRIGTPKYSYSFKDDDRATTMTSEENIAGTPPSEDDGETMAERKARRKASHPLAWPMVGATNEIEANS